MDWFIFGLASCIAFVLGVYCGRRKKKELMSLSTTYTELEKDVSSLLATKDNLQEQVNQLYLEEAKCKDSLQLSLNQTTEAQEKHKALIESMETEEKNLTFKYQLEEQKMKEAIEILENKRRENQLQYQQEEEKLNNIKVTISAGAEALKQQALQRDELKKYQLYVSEKDLTDIKKLYRISEDLTNPRILYMLIWTTYFQKETKELCTRIGVNGVSGIYKITDLTNEKTYVGQSVKISDRLTQHIKKGLGIDTPTTNALYKGMRENGVWNFTFSLLEQCTESQLDDCERKWIEIYNSNNYGYNSTKGNKGGLS